MIASPKVGGVVTIPARCPCESITGLPVGKGPGAVSSITAPFGSAITFAPVTPPLTINRVTNTRARRKWGWTRMPLSPY